MSFYEENEVLNFLNSNRNSNSLRSDVILGKKRKV